MSAQDLWVAAAPLIAATEKHPFLLGMVDGTLDMEAFRYYVVQDALYLNDFADCLQLLGKNDGIDQSDANRLATFAKGTKDAEMALHNSFFVQWEISAKGTEQMPNCLLYTSYEKRIVATRCHAEGLAVLLPCFWVYMHVGKCMLKLREESADKVQRPAAFDAWIDMYAGDEFELRVKEFIAMVDAACKTADEETLKCMEKHFVIGCKLEHMFWDQAQFKMQWPGVFDNASS